jgi:hypothetical protein
MQHRFCSIFSQLLQLFSRTEFEGLVQDWKAERHARGFSCWSQFVAMLFCQLGRAHSLREICGGLASCEGKLAHLGVKAAPSRSTLAYANGHRPYELYMAVFHQLLDRCQVIAGEHRRKFRFKNKLLSLDATVIPLCASIFDWAKFRRKKGAVKLHLVLDHDGYLPTFALITEGKESEVHLAHDLPFEPGSIVVVDRAFFDYCLLGQWTEQGVFFVTRLKARAAYRRTERLAASPDANVGRDDKIELTSPNGQRECPHPLRRIVYTDPQTGRQFEFLTNNFHLAATTIAQIYKERWQIELFFKALKQNLKVKTFVGTSANALQTQIWIALIAMLLLRFLQLKSKFAWSLSNLVALLRMNLFVYRDLWIWLNKPFADPPQLPEVAQPALEFG